MWLVLLPGTVLSGSCHGPKGRWATLLSRNVHRNQIQKCSLLPRLSAGWRDLGGLALTLALENTSILCIDEGSDASRRIIILDISPSAKALPP